MTHLIGSDLAVMLSIIASVLVLFYVLGYVLISYVQKKQGALRPDFSISMIFYLGIAILALGYLFEVFDFRSVFDISYLISIILFVYGFEKRSGYAAQLQAQVRGKTQKKKK